MAEDPQPPLSSATPADRRHARLRGLTLPEISIVVVISGLLMAAVLSQWLESTSLALKAAETLEYTRSTRELVFRLSEDVRNAQRLIVYNSFKDRVDFSKDGDVNTPPVGNYLVLQEVNLDAEITRTVGYYLMEEAGGGGWILFRHDSNDGGGLSLTDLPAPASEGDHRRVTRAVTLPDSDNLFRVVRDRAVAIRGEFGAAGRPVKRGRTEFVQCILSTRS
ncbi:MAG: pilus assembly FimT family protein [Opitutaceae bacterium]